MEVRHAVQGWQNGQRTLESLAGEREGEAFMSSILGLHFFLTREGFSWSDGAQDGLRRIKDAGAGKRYGPH